MTNLTEKERQATEFAHELIAEFLDTDLWTFKLDRRSRKTHGACIHSLITGGGVIELASFVVKYGDDDEVFDTLTHEIAHAIHGPYEGHGPKWQATHKALGGNGKQYADDMPDAPRGKWAGHCEACEKIVAYRWRLSAQMRTAVHNPCGGTKVTWVEIG